MVLAYLWVFPLGAPGLRPTLVGWSVLFPKEPLTPSVDLAQILAILLAVTVPYASLSIVPAWRAASADPMEALRG
jgi:lipoprotein-releasing system permease protein